jgi:hypothetical protein
VSHPPDPMVGAGPLTANTQTNQALSPDHDLRNVEEFEPASTLHVLVQSWFTARSAIMSASNHFNSAAVEPPSHD